MGKYNQLLGECRLRINRGPDLRIGEYPWQQVELAIRDLEQERDAALRAADIAELCSQCHRAADPICFPKHPDMEPWCEECEELEKLRAEVERLRGDFMDAAGMKADEFAAIRARGGRDWAKLHSPLGKARERIAELEAAIVKTWRSMDEAPPPFFTTQGMRNAIVGACKVANVRPWEASE